MSRYHSYLNSAVQMLKLYDGEEPFASFQRNFFSVNKKYGSKDRKQINNLCYCYFRLGKALENLPAEERILIGSFLCSTEPNQVLEAFKPEWNEHISDFFEEKKSMLMAPFSILNIFPWKEELSHEIDCSKFCESFLIQPDLFLRLRPGYEDCVKEKLFSAKINFKEIAPSCLALANTSKLDDVIELDKEAIVQDYNSQRVGEFLSLNGSLTAWDSCAGSGGKSLLLHDINPNIDLSVSDVRESILINLKKRFHKAGIKKYNSFITDITHLPLTIQHSPFDIIVCDAPCTGSGTWSRTPEQLYFFEKEKIEQYAALQKKIVSNLIPHLKENGFLVYITCSVFKKENEEAVDYIKQTFHLELVKMELLKGYDKKADTMFVAVLKKPL